MNEKELKIRNASKLHDKALDELCTKDLSYKEFDKQAEEMQKKFAKEFKLFTAYHDGEIEL